MRIACDSKITWPPASSAAGEPSFQVTLPSTCPIREPHPPRATRARTKPDRPTDRLQFMSAPRKKDGVEPKAWATERSPTPSRLPARAWLGSVRGGDDVAVRPGGQPAERGGVDRVADRPHAAV